MKYRSFQPLKKNSPAKTIHLKVCSYKFERWKNRNVLTSTQNLHLNEGHNSILWEGLNMRSQPKKQINLRHTLTFSVSRKHGRRTKVEKDLGSFVKSLRVYDKQTRRRRPYMLQIVLVSNETTLSIMGRNIPLENLGPVVQNKKNCRNVGNWKVWGDYVGCKDFRFETKINYLNPTYICNIVI